MLVAKPEYLEKARTLDGEEKERLLSRMKGKLPKRLDRDKIDIEDALAIQMELEDEQLDEWRKNMQALRSRTSEK